MNTDFYGQTHEWPRKGLSFDQKEKVFWGSRSYAR
jgi:hypothetical protein